MYKLFSSEAEKRWTEISILSSKMKGVNLMKELKKTEFIGTKLNSERKKEIEKYADGLGISVAALINLALTYYMNNN